MQSGVPSHKVIPGTSITVDGFRHVQPWVKAYFLSHAHSDHYGGITENWSAGPIYCSPVTAALVQQLTGVAAEFVKALELNTTHTVEGVQVTLVDANHCPGAVQFLFELADGRRYIHCGDMRYCSDMKHNQQLARFIGADALFLDTTYCHPKHTFPCQAEAVEFVASRIHQLLQEDVADVAQPGRAAAGSNEQQQQQQAHAAAKDTQPQQQHNAADTEQRQQLQPTVPSAAQDQQQQADAAAAGEGPVPCAGGAGFKRLYLISTYVIGKERLLLAVAERTGRRLLVTHRKMEVLRCIGLPQSALRRCFTLDPCETPIHVLSWGSLGDTWPYFRPNFTNMEAARQAAGAQEVVGFVPTGWLYEMRQQAYPSRAKGPCSLHLVPYSEHSSYAELREFVGWIRPKQVIPTVGVSEPGAAGAKARAALLKHFRGLLDEQHNKAAFLARMSNAGRTAPATRAAEGSKTLAVADAAVTATAAAQNDDSEGVMVPRASSDNNDDDSDGNEGDDLSVATGRECEGADEDRGDKVAVGAILTSTAAAAGSTTPKAVLETAETAGVPATSAAAAAAQAQGADPSPCVSSESFPVQANSTAAAAAASAAGVDVLLAVAGADLTAAEAQKLLEAAAGDVNAAVNAFLDQQTNQQQQSLTQAVHNTGNGSGSGSKRQLSASGRATASNSSKKARKQGSGGTPAAAGHQASITAFFSPKTAAKAQQNQQQQQQQQRGSSSSQQQSSSPGGVDAAAGQAAAAAGPQKPSAVVLPPLHRKLVPAAAAGSRGRKQSPAANSPPVRDVDRSAAAVASSISVQQQQQRQHSVDDSRTAGSQPIPVAAAGALPGTTTAHTGAAAAAAQMDARQTPSPQQQQQQWHALLPGSKLPRSAKHSAAQISSKCSAQPSSAAPPAAAAAANTIPADANHQQQEDAAPTEPQEAPSSPAAAAAAATQVSSAKTAVGSGGSSSSSILLGTKNSSSSSKSITKAIRDAPLLPLSQYHPVHDACWCPGGPAPYLAVALTLAAVDGTSSRLRIADGLTNLFRSLMLLAPDQVTAAAYLICGKIAPEYVPGAELSVGGGVVSSALSEVCGVSRAQLRSMYSSYGDLGDLAQACRRSQSHLLPPPPLTIQGVFAALHSLAAQSGQGATARRQATVAKLLRCCRDVETKYLVRTLVANLRVGAAWKSVLGPLAKAALLHRKMMQEAGLMQAAAAAATGQDERQQQQQKDSVPAAAAAACSNTGSSDVAVLAAAAAPYASSAAAKVSKQQLEAAAAAAAAAYHTCPNLGVIVDVLMSEGPEALSSRVQLTCGVPVKPMLAKGCTSVADSFKQLAATAVAAAVALTAARGGGGVAVGKGGRRKAANGGVAAAAADRCAAAGKGSVGLAAAAAAAAAVAAAPPAADSAGAVSSSEDSGSDSSGEECEPDEVVEADEAEQELLLDRKPAHLQPPDAAAAAGVVPTATASSSSSSRCLSVLAEYKYDGQRAQIHVGTGGQVHIFSRNCEDRTAAFPDVVAAMLAAADPQQLPLVLDAELVAVDRARGNRVRAFQELATRPRTAATAAAAGVGSSGGIKRSSISSVQGSEVQQKQQKLTYSTAAPAAALLSKADTAGCAEAAEIPEQLVAQIDTTDIQQQQQQQASKQQQQQSGSGVDICVFVFDALCVAGRDLMGLSLRQRRQAMLAALPGLSPGLVQMAEGLELQVPLAAASGADHTNAAAAAAGVTTMQTGRATVGSTTLAETDNAAAAAAAAAGVTAAAAAAAGNVADDITDAQAPTPDSTAAAAAALPPNTPAAAVDSVSSAESAAMEFFHAALAAGSEGLMMKLLDGPGSVYQPAKRGLSWVKLKRDYLEGLADSLDLVPIGAWRGQGRKVHWFSPFLLAVYDPATETYQSLCRCMSGFTDDFYAAATERLGATAIAGPKQYYDTGERPDVWLAPTEVWEIRGADITISPVHRAAAGLVDPDKGLGLRFPRFLRLRPDKQPEEASGPDSVQHLYNQQHRRIRLD